MAGVQLSFLSVLGARDDKIKTTKTKASFPAITKTLRAVRQEDSERATPSMCVIFLRLWQQKCISSNQKTLETNEGNQSVSSCAKGKSIDISGPFARKHLVLAVPEEFASYPERKMEITKCNTQRILCKKKIEIRTCMYRYCIY